MRKGGINIEVSRFNLYIIYFGLFMFILYMVILYIGIK